MNHLRLSRIGAASASGLSFIILLLLVFLPIYSGVAIDSSNQLAHKTTATLIEVNGYRVLIFLIIPVLISAAELSLIWFLRSPRAFRITAVWVLTAFLLGFLVVTIFSIGIFYLSVFALLVAASILA